MLLRELFERDQEPSMLAQLRREALDMLTPRAAHRQKYVTVQEVIDHLRELQTGLAIDRGLIMDILDPDQVEIVSKIEGDKIWLGIPQPDDKKSAEEEVSDAEALENDAQKQAAKEIAKDRKPLAKGPVKLDF